MTAPTPRIATLDYLRGVAVLGILVANLPGFALPHAAYFSPLAWGGTRPADIAVWFATFVLVEGKMRGLFAMLFGASMLLVLERAEAAGRDPAAVHLRRMASLFAIGCAHLYLVWYGDILAHYALVGTIALLFAAAGTRLLLVAALACLLIATLNGLALLQAVGDPGARAALEQSFGRPPPAVLLREIGALRGSLADGIAWRWNESAGPLTALLFNGPETLGYMLLGMAGLRSGFLTGAWPARRYALLGAVTLLATMPLHVAAAWRTVAHGFDMPSVVTASFAIERPLRPVTVVGYAALLILACRWDGPVTRAVAAAGRMALSNYLLCSVLLAAVFYGWGAGRFAHWGRAESYMLLLPLWTAMLCGSRWWLGRFGQGPFELAWRRIARIGA